MHLQMLDASTIQSVKGSQGHYITNTKSLIVQTIFGVNNPL